MPEPVAGTPRVRQRSWRPALTLPCRRGSNRNEASDYHDPHEAHLVSADAIRMDFVHPARPCATLSCGRYGPGPGAPGRGNWTLNAARLPAGGHRESPAKWASFAAPAGWGEPAVNMQTCDGGTLFQARTGV